MTIVQSGEVMVNGKVVAEPSFQVEPGEDHVRYKGKLIGAKPSEYVILHKPSGYVTTKEDSFARKKVTDLLPEAMKHLNPVGRLDKETEGLLLLTNDGDLLHRLTHPKFDVGKKYYVRVKGDLDPVQKSELEKGVMLDGKKTSPATISNVQSDGKVTDFHMVIHEGWNRQIRRMCEDIGLPVRYLKRIQHGPIKLGDLKLGRWRRLTQEEIKILKGEGEKM
jgi:pseudouridine synthase